MNKLGLILLFLIRFLFSSCSAQKSSSNELFIPEFKWKLKIPEFLIAENTEEWKKVQSAGKKVFEDTYNTELTNKVKTIFIFKSSDKSFFEAVSEPISQEQAENYVATCEKMNDLAYNAIKAQVPTAQIDTTKHEEVIDDFPFQVLKIKLTFSDGSNRTSISYRRVFGNTELTISAMYGNQASGDNIAKAITSSQFEK